MPRRKKSEGDFNKLVEWVKALDVGKYASTIQHGDLQVEISVRVSRRVDSAAHAQYFDAGVAYLRKSHWLNGCESPKERQQFFSSSQCSRPFTHLVVTKSALEDKLFFTRCCSQHANERRTLTSTVDVVEIPKYVLDKIKRERAKAAT